MSSTTFLLRDLGGGGGGGGQGELWGGDYGLSEVDGWGILKTP